MHDSFPWDGQHPFFCLYYLKQHSPTQARDNKTFIPLIPNNSKFIFDNVHKHSHMYTQEKVGKIIGRREKKYKGVWGLARVKSG